MWSLNINKTTCATYYYCTVHSDDTTERLLLTARERIKTLTCSESIVNTTPEGALIQNETTSTHTSEENDDVVCIVILHWRTLGVFLASLLIPHCTGKDAYCLYIRLVCFSSQKKNPSRSPPSSDYRRVASVALVSSISTRKNEFQHARHSGDKCFAEHHVGTNEDSVWIPWKHRGTQIVST